MNDRPSPYASPDAPAVSPPARRAGMLVIALGSVSLLIGGLCLLFVILLPQMEQSPELAKTLDDMRRQAPFDPRLLIGVMGGIFLIYALAAIPLGLLARRGRLGWVVTALVFVTCAGLLVGLSALLNVGAGKIGEAFLPGLLTVLHGLAASWLIGALRQHAATPMQYSPLIPQNATPTGPVIGQPFMLPPPPRPMDDYYASLPPAPPTTRERLG